MCDASPLIDLAAWCAKKGNMLKAAGLLLVIATSVSALKLPNVGRRQVLTGAVAAGVR